MRAEGCGLRVEGCGLRVARTNCEQLPSNARRCVQTPGGIEVAPVVAKGGVQRFHDPK